MAKKLNTPMIVTQAIDLFVLYSFTAANIYWLGNNITPLYSVISFNLILLSLLFHDHLYCILFPSQIAKIKTDYKVTWEDIYYYSKFIPGIYSLTLFFLVKWNIIDFEYKNLFSFIVRTSFEYWLMYLFKDFTTMKFLHAIMHTPRWYHTHEVHHKIGANIQIINAFHFDTLDVFLENLIGPFIVIIFNYFTYGTLTVHFMSFIFIVWSDVLAHSLNPYSALFGNPIVDYLMKPNVEHNLHHMLINQYFMLNSLEHLFVKGKMDRDLALYNKVCDTKFSTNLYIDA